MGFDKWLDDWPWERVGELIASRTAADVERALAAHAPSLDDFAALISPAAADFLPPLAARSHAITQRRFGRTIQLYIPMYLSNECQNICTYCGFSFTNTIPRKTLNDAEILAEVQAVKALGYNSILLVTGEASTTVGVSYLCHAIRLIKPFFASITIEVQPLSAAEYGQLQAAGCTGVLVYQETYHRDTYRIHHPKGKKSNFDFRLATPDRIAEGGINRIGLGVLLGLEDWRIDAWLCALHLKYMRQTHWRSRYSISFPRLRPAEGVAGPKVEITDKELAGLICAWRLLDNDLDLSLSTRESQRFRDGAIKLGITSISAGSRTNPGGYAQGDESLEQFEVDDMRSPAEMATVISHAGYTPVWKDWDEFIHAA